MLPLALMLINGLSDSSGLAQSRLLFRVRWCRALFKVCYCGVIWYRFVTFFLAATITSWLCLRQRYLLELRGISHYCPSVPYGCDHQFFHYMIAIGRGSSLHHNHSVPNTELVSFGFLVVHAWFNVFHTLWVCDSVLFWYGSGNFTHVSRPLCIAAKGLIPVVECGYIRMV